jgi:hypothetical protein
VSYLRPGSFPATVLKTKAGSRFCPTV